MKGTKSWYMSNTSHCTVSDPHYIHCEQWRVGSVFRYDNDIDITLHGKHFLGFLHFMLSMQPSVVDCRHLYDDTILTYCINGMNTVLP